MDGIRVVGVGYWVQRMGGVGMPRSAGEWVGFLLDAGGSVGSCCSS